MNNYKIYPKQYLSVNMLVDKNKCFVIMPFADELNHVYGTIKRELTAAGFICNRVDEIKGSTPIIAKILTEMLKSRYIIADLTDCNPNVFYELGIAHSFKDAQNIIILKQKGSKIPFDITHLTYIEYEPDNLLLLTSSIIDYIQTTRFLVDLEDALQIRGIISPINSTKDFTIIDFYQENLNEEISLLTKILLDEHKFGDYTEEDIEFFLTKYFNSLLKIYNCSDPELINQWLKAYNEILISCEKYDVSKKFINDFLNREDLLKFVNKNELLSWRTDMAISMANVEKYQFIVIPWIINYLSHSQTASIDLNRYKVEAFLMTNQTEKINQIIADAVFDKNCYIREHISDIIGEKKLYIASDNLCIQLQNEENYYSAVSIIEALGKLNCTSSIEIIINWVKQHESEMIKEKQFFVLNHVRIVLKKLLQDKDLELLKTFDDKYAIYLEDYYIL